MLDSVYRHLPWFLEAMLKSNAVLVKNQKIWYGDHKINLFKPILYHLTPYTLQRIDTANCDQNGAGTQLILISVILITDDRCAMGHDNIKLDSTFDTPTVY